MKMISKMMAAAGLLTLAACSGGADDKAARNVEAAAENKADMMRESADNMTNGVAADMTERRADRVEEAGERKADAIDRNDGPTTNTVGTTGNRVESNISGM